MIVQEHLPKTLFAGKTVFITGGGSGINLGVARNFAALGAHLAICGRTQSKLDAAAEELRALDARVCVVPADVRDFAALEAAFARSNDEFGPMDVLVCGAAGNFLVPAEQLSPNGFKTVIDIEKKIAEFGVKARDGKLGIEELTGGTFSISNGGVFGSMLSTPIINPPQSAILGVHATKDRAVVENGQVVVRPMNYLAMSYDHRIIDGREAVLGLVAMKEALEDPARLLFDI